MGWRSAALALSLLLVGCNQDAQAPEEIAIEQQGAVGGAGSDIIATGSTAAMAPPGDDYADMDRAAQNSPAPPPPPPAPQPGQQPTQGSPQQTTAGAAPIMYLAYAYQTGLRIPGDRLIGVMDAHIQACQQAGPRLCQLVGSNRSGDPESYVSGMVQMRGEPTWLRGFMGGLERQADQAGGRVVSQSTSTEDLTRAIVDTEAQLRAKRALRDRLQRLLETRPGRLSDLLEAERALAQVQGEIDAVESGLAVMRSRVSMSELTLTYESSAEPLRSDLFEPLTQALANFAGWIVKGLAAIITVVAVLLPWAGLAWLVLWLTRGWRARRRGWFWRRRAEPPPETDA